MTGEDGPCRKWDQSGKDSAGDSIGRFGKIETLIGRLPRQLTEPCPMAIEFRRSPASASPSPKCTVRSLVEAYPTLPETVRTCRRPPAWQRTSAPIAERLLFRPGQPQLQPMTRGFCCGVRFHQSSMGAFSAVTAASRRPSRSKSAKTTPRCSAGCRKSLPTASVTSSKCPARLRKMRLDCASCVSSPPPATNRSSQPSLSRSTRPQPQPFHLRLRFSRPVRALPSSKDAAALV